MDDVHNTHEELRSSGSVSANAQPVIVIVRERQRSRDKYWSLKRSLTPPVATSRW
jgi:hypothetical protein